MQKFFTLLAEATTFRSLRAACIDFFTRQGAQMASYHHMPPVGSSDYDAPLQVAAFGFPAEWVERYVSQRYYDFDPIPKQALAGSRPFWWADIRQRSDLTEQEEFYLDELDKADLGAGLAIPVFGPHGRNGYASVGFGKRGITLTDFEIAELQWACQLGHLRYTELITCRAAGNVHLSEREYQILHWVARGKSNSVIAEIIGISTHTVDTYMRRLYTKLDVSDRVTAALRGLAIGVVT